MQPYNRNDNGLNNPTGSLKYFDFDLLNALGRSSIRTSQAKTTRASRSLQPMNPSCRSARTDQLESPAGFEDIVHLWKSTMH